MIVHNYSYFKELRKRSIIKSMHNAKNRIPPPSVPIISIFIQISIKTITKEVLGFVSPFLMYINISPESFLLQMLVSLFLTECSIFPALTGEVIY